METKTTCPNCNEPIDEGATFCGNCGFKLNPIVSSSPISTEPVVSTFEQPKVPAPVVGGITPGDVKGKPESSGEKKSIIALVLGVIGIPASLLPIAGLILGVAGLVLGTTARVKYKHTLNLLAIIFSSIAVIAAIGFWVHNIESNQKSKSYTQTGPLVTISTSCFNVKVDKATSHFIRKGCNFDSTGKTEEFAVVAIDNPNVTTSNLAATGAKSLQDGAVTSGGQISNGHMGTFAGSTAYLANYSSSTKGTSGVFAFVIHKTPKGDNVFIIGRAVVGSGLDSFGTLESTWQWK